MVHLSSRLAIGLLWALSRTLSVVALDPPADPPAVDGDATFGFPSINITDILAKAERELGANGTVTENPLPVDVGIVGTHINMTGHDIQRAKLHRRHVSQSVLGMIACAALFFACPKKLAKTGTNEFFLWNNPAFWSSTTYMTPACVFRPSTVDELSLGMRIISCTNADFNVVSGGHSSIKGWANVQNGVLISTADLDEVTIQSSRNGPNYVQVGAGQRWGEVYKRLDEQKLMVLGGRMSSVGVSGLTLGGGISYLTNERGFAADQVMNFQVVLYNGCIVNANARENSDLFRALKGGSSNFGIVTRFDLYTFPCPGVYAGQLQFLPNAIPKLFPIIYNYHKADASDFAITHLISAFVYVGAMNLHLGAFTAFRNAPRAETGVALKEILTKCNDANELKNFTLANTVQVRPYGTVAIELGASDVTGLRQDMRDFSAYAQRDIYSALWNIWNDKVVSKFGTVNGFQGTIAFQPISQAAARAGTSTGGNSLGLENNSGTMVIINLTHQWNDPSKDAAIIQALDQCLSACISYVKSKGVYHPYYYLNYAGKDIDVIENYGSASVNRMKTVARKYDPYGLFQNSVPGGFKVPGAAESCARNYW
ncbi:Bifunctional solanapyrone synthase [Drechslerella dactyloides]|uniref:Bifunctional solanapyrone synthase n=1 Tax=Drechslerella dactyloides TaxID=74499 RepID=A0AAD6IVV7_DREDA|nr:Bifunctional solanapyrone synthase [Drechslerella dactyloides]